MSIIPEDFLDLLETKTVTHLATIGPKGEPQVNPIWFVWDGTYIRFSMNKVRQKYRNLKRDPRVALSFVDPADPYRSLEIRGKVVRLEDDVNYHFTNAVLNKKYTGQVYDEQNVNPNIKPGEERIIAVIEPLHATFFLHKEEK